MNLPDPQGESPCAHVRHPERLPTTRRWCNAVAGERLGAEMAEVGGQGRHPDPQPKPVPLRPCPFSGRNGLDRVPSAIN
ncbi:hypothetical protein J6590_019228 [Homalodisca vitripennis]|nr:hypothetical protein J6590_019228 [Homalodisca vitripennis]